MYLTNEERVYEKKWHHSQNSFLKLTLTLNIYIYIYIYINTHIHITLTYIVSVIEIAN